MFRAAWQYFRNVNKLSIIMVKCHDLNTDNHHFYFFKSSMKPDTNSCNMHCHQILKYTESFKALAIGKLVWTRLKKSYQTHKKARQWHLSSKNSLKPKTYSCNILRRLILNYTESFKGLAYLKFGLNSFANFIPNKQESKSLKTIKRP